MNITATSHILHIPILLLQKSTEYTNLFISFFSSQVVIHTRKIISIQESKICLTTHAIQIATHGDLFHLIHFNILQNLQINKHNIYPIT
jgi:hypothetical protein